MWVSNAQFERICKEAVKELRGVAPYDTGNLAMNAIKMEMVSPSVCLIYVDERIAPYMPYTTFPWISPKWNGKKNPNEGWWQAAGEMVVKYVAKRVNGSIYNG